MSTTSWLLPAPQPEPPARRPRRGGSCGSRSPGRSGPSSTATLEVGLAPERVGDHRGLEPALGARARRAASRSRRSPRRRTGTAARRGRPMPARPRAARPRAKSFFCCTSSTDDRLPRQGAGHEHHAPASSRPRPSPPAATVVISITGGSTERGYGSARMGPMTDHPGSDRRIEIVPSVLPADFSRLGEEVAALEEAGVDRIQWDVMDGRFVPNLTFGPDVIAACRPHATVPFEAHLMVEEPDDLAARYVEAGCEMLIVHAEACRHLHRTLGHLRELGARPAVALNPSTPAERGRPRARPGRPGAGDDRQPGLRRPGLHRHDGAEGRRGAAARPRRRPRRRHRGRRRDRPRPRSRARRRPAPTCWWPVRRCTATPRASPTRSPSCGSWPRPPAVEPTEEPRWVWTRQGRCAARRRVAGHRQGRRRRR